MESADSLESLFLEDSSWVYLRSANLFDMPMAIMNCTSKFCFELAQLYSVEFRNSIGQQNR